MKDELQMAPSKMKTNQCLGFKLFSLNLTHPHLFPSPSLSQFGRGKGRVSEGQEGKGEGFIMD
jgi:hypothetical protein